MTDAIRRAERVQRLLDDDLMKEAREHMRDGLTKALWRRHTLAQDDRDRLDAMVRYHESFWSWFERVLADGKLAEIDEQNKAQAASVMERLREKFRT